MYIYRCPFDCCLSKMRWEENWILLVVSPNRYENKVKKNREKKISENKIWWMYRLAVVDHHHGHTWPNDFFLLLIFFFVLRSNENKNQKQEEKCCCNRTKSIQLMRYFNTINCNGAITQWVAMTMKWIIK